MRRPGVLHVVEHWSRPSEGFVRDLIGSTTSTRAVVAAVHRDPDSAAPAGVRLHDLGSPLTRRVPAHVALAAVAVRERVSVVHAHFGQMAHLAWRVSRRLGLPLSVSVHGWDVLVGARGDPGIGEALRAAELVIVPSRFLAGAVEGLGVSPHVIRVVPSGLDLARYPWRCRDTRPEVPTVTFAGRFAEKKGVLDVARALATVAETTPLRARFVGFGPLEEPLRDLLGQLSLASEIVDGRVPGAVVDALAATDLAVTASRTAADGDAETLCLVNLEAQACGVPLVTTRHGGIPEAVSEAAALLVDEGPAIPEQLAAALSDLLAAPQRWPEMGAAGRRFVAERFELGAQVADVESLWRALADGGRGIALPVAAPAPTPQRASVVVVTHNRRALLERCLDALAAQTRPPDEVVVVDNGSDDGTDALLSARVRAGRPANLTVLRRDANLPVAEGRNIAVARSSGEVVVFTDDDCRPQPTWLEAMLSGFAAGADLVQGRTTADPKQPLMPLSRTQWTPAEFGLYETCNVGYRRSALDRSGPVAPAGPFDLGFARTVAETLGSRWERYPFGEDTELGWRVRRSGASTRFAVHAVVEHEVFPPDPALVLRRAALAAAFPVLVREVPELRDDFLTHRVMLGPQHIRWWLAAAGVVAAAATRKPILATATLPYAAAVLRPREIVRPGWRRARLAAVPVLLRRDAREVAALIRGSVRARTVVL